LEQEIKKNGICLDLTQLDEVAKKFENVKRPLYHRFTDYNVKSVEECEKFVENEAKKFDLYGENPEGFVLFLGGVPVAKVKNKGYHKVHSILTGNILFLRNFALKAFFEESLDDVYGYLPQPIHQYIEELKEKTKKK